MLVTALPEKPACWAAARLPIRGVDGAEERRHAVSGLDKTNRIVKQCAPYKQLSLRKP